MIDHKCDYCGGWTDGDASGGNLHQTHVDLHLSGGKTNQQRSICADCWIKVFDKVLGEKKDD